MGAGRDMLFTMRLFLIELDKKGIQGLVDEAKTMNETLGKDENSFV